mgnify:CR=1 FL=1|jgi:hypothetical protein|tara:strand:- start:4574 stop:5248 length:675 start_codon:yes stop_codon:yes gene_type:complete
MTIEIPDIPDMNVTNIPDMPDYLTSQPPTAIPIYPPVTEQVGVPIINIPGCVEAHEGGTDTIMADDPDGVKVYCDANTPSFNPIDYNRNKLKFETEAPVPPIAPPPKKPEVKTEEVKTDTKTEIPVVPQSSAQEPFLGNEYLPKNAEVSSTITIAFAAASAGLLARPVLNFILRVLKPAAKTAFTKVLKKLKPGYQAKFVGVRDRQRIQREKEKSKDILKKLLG